MSRSQLDIDFLIRQIDALPTLPTIYYKLLEIMDNPRSTVKDVADVIMQDQASAAKVLKAANSPIYGLYGKIENISQAISYIGFDEVKNLIIALTVIDFFNSKFDIKYFNPVSFWQHSIAVGLMSRIVGKATHAKDLENYFLAGIMHDIGKLLFMITIPVEYSKVLQYCQDHKVSTREGELNILGITHNIAGEVLATKWNLPLAIKNSIRYHETGMLDNNNKSITASTHISNVAVCMFGLCYSEDFILPKPNIEVWDVLQLPENFFSTNSNLLLNSYKESTNLLLR